MSWHALLTWTGPALDVLVLLGLAAIGWRLRHDPSAAWRTYEVRLRETQESLKLLVLQAEGEARELDRRLATLAEQLQAHAQGATASPAALVSTVSQTSESAAPAGSANVAASAQVAVKPATSSANGTARTARAARTPASEDGASAPSLAERVQQLAAARTPIEEIARRLSLPVAEARVLAGLTTGASAYGGGALRAAATTRATAARTSS